MQSFATLLVHLSGDGICTIPSEAIDAHAQKKMSSRIVGRAEQSVDIALAVTDVDAARWLRKQCGRLLQILQPADLSFSSTGTRVGLMCRFSSSAPSNFSRLQNFTAVSPSDSPSVVTAGLGCIKMPHAV